jgi:hypothetical protein
MKKGSLVEVSYFDGHMNFFEKRVGMFLKKSRYVNRCVVYADGKIIKLFTDSVREIK